MSRSLHNLAIAAIAALALLAVFTAPTVFAYPPGQTTIGTNSSSYAPGAPMTITVDGFGACAGQPITITVTSSSGVSASYTGTVGSGGTFSMTVPAGQAGTYSISAEAGVCAAGPTGIVVASSGPTDGPKTGGESVPTFVTGIICAVLGGLFVLVAVRRRRYYEDA